MSDAESTPGAAFTPGVAPSEEAARARAKDMPFDLIDASDAAAKDRETASATERALARGAVLKRKRGGIKPRRVGLYAFLVTITFIWMMPLLVAVYEALRTNALRRGPRLPLRAPET